MCQHSHNRGQILFLAPFAADMKVVSVNVGQPRELFWRDQLVKTSIFKTAVAGPVRVRRLNLDGDEQPDPAVHGGVAAMSITDVLQQYKR